MKTIDQNIDQYLEEVGRDSEEHKKYLEKLIRVLNDMKSSASQAEKKHYIPFKQTVDNFSRFLVEKNIKLIPEEENRFSIIAASGLNNLAKKRMAEDLIHQIKNRVATDLSQKIELDKMKKDIALLNKSKFRLADWCRLTKFAFKYNTITLFFHRYKAESLNIITIKCALAYNEIKSELKSILDEYYYYLTVLEYNAIVKLYNMGEAIDNLIAMNRSPSYNPSDILEQMNDFTSSFIYVMRNINSIDRGLEKVTKNRQSVHGFIGNVWFLTDRKIFNNKVKRYRKSEIMNKTIAGSLYSFYTSSLGVIVNTFNQLMYITKVTGELDHSKKEYTLEATRKIENESRTQNEEINKTQSKLSEIINITTKYSDMGKILSKRLFEIEARSSLSAWNKDAQTKPFFKLIKIFDAYIKYILEMIIGSENLELEYDNNTIKNYFERYPHIIKAIEECRAFSVDLQGTKGKDLQNYKISSENEKNEFIQNLMGSESTLSLPSGTKHLRETLNEMSAICYNICMRFNDLLNKYYQSEKIELNDIADNYNFLFNAKIIHPKVRNLETILNKKQVYLVDLLEACCSMAVFFSESLYHKGIQAVYADVIKLQREIDEYNLESRVKIQHFDTEDDENRANNRIYNDTLTGIKNWQYFEDFILPEFYDDDGNYSKDKLRHVFCMKLSNLVEINRICGNDVGNVVYKKFSKIAKETFSTTDSDSILLRYKEGLIIGYIDNTSVIEAVDILFKILNKIKAYSLNSGIQSLPDIIFNAGIYTERKGSNALKNIEIAQKIMQQRTDKEAGHVVFLRHADRIIKNNDFNSKGELKPEFVSVLS
ncbi:MAG: diguanylate cyclase [Spirochaetes bacterium]|nr:diguanylate cyclase [Spirochaetota bacterium]